jgi:phytoene synthase
MDDSYAHCAALVREADRDRYLAALFIPAAARPHVLALYAFNIEIGAIRERIHESMAGEVRLQWWRDALAGRAAGGIAGHPVALAFLDTIRRFGLPLADLERMIEARAFDLYGDPMPSREVFAGYLRATASAIFMLAGRMISAEGTAVGAVAEQAGPAYGITGLLRAFPLHVSRGQIYLPADLLDENGVDQGLMLRGQSHAGLLNALAELRDDARKYLMEARRLLPAVTRETRSAFLPLALAERHLERMDRAGYDPFRTSVEIPQWRRQWLLWRAARKLR